MIGNFTLTSFAFFSILGFAIALPINATTEQTDIEISITHTEYVNFIGTAPGASRFYDNDDIVNFIFPTTVNLGTLGLESNLTGDCDLQFSTLNNFRLLHTITSQNLANYRVLYAGNGFDASNNQTLTIPCNSTPSNIDFILTGLSLAGFDAFIPSGIYNDTVMITVTTQ